MANILIQCLSKKDAAPVLALHMAKGFADNNHCVYCLISNKIENLNDWLQDIRLNVQLIDTGNRKNFVMKSLKMLFVTKYKIKQRYQKIYFAISIQPFVHPWGAIINSAIKSKHKLGICHDPNPHSGESFVNRFFAYIGYSSTNELLVLTKSFLPVVRKKYNKPVYYMPLGLLTNNIRSTQYEQADSCVNFLFFGRIEKYKGIAVLLNAYKKISANNISLTIAGSGNFTEYQEIVDSCKNINIINRYIYNSELEDLFLKPNTVLVVPYLDATQSGVIPIAIDFEVPVIASDTGGLKEQLNDGNIGVFVNPGDIDELAFAMNSFVIDPNTYISHRQKIAEYKPLLKWDSITKTLLDDLD